MDDLAKSAMLVSITIKFEGLLGERRDKAASSLVSSHYSAEESRAKASKFLINRRHPSVKGVIAAAQQVRAVVYRYTFPWGDSNLRLLPAKAYPEFKTKLDQAFAGLNDALERYYTFYPYLVSQSETELGSLFDRSQYPDLDRVKSMFKVSVGYMPMPQTGHFVADIAASAAKEARETIIQQRRDATQEAFNSLVERVERSVELMVNSLSQYKPKRSKDDKISGIFRDSLIENVSDIAKLIRVLNFTDDLEIDRLATQAERLARYSAEVLRNNNTNRDEIVTEGQALLGKLSAMKRLDKEVDDMAVSIVAYY